MADENVINMYIGDHETLEVTVYDSDDEDTRAVVPLVGTEKVWFTVRLKISDDDYVIQKKSLSAGGGNDEILITDGTNGVLEIYLEPADTIDETATRYIYDVQVEYDGEIKTIIKSRLILEDHVTKEYS